MRMACRRLLRFIRHCRFAVRHCGLLVVEEHKNHVDRRGRRYWLKSPDARAIEESGETLRGDKSS